MQGTLAFPYSPPPRLAHSLYLFRKMFWDTMKEMGIEAGMISQLEPHESKIDVIFQKMGRSHNKLTSITSQRVDLINVESSSPAFP